MLGLLAALPLAAQAARAQAMWTALAAPPADAATTPSASILIGGPEGGTLDRWGSVLGPALARSLPPDTRLRRTAVGASDGVTAANQFEARTPPDGQTLLLAPRDSALAWLVGDPRAQYDVGQWVPVLAAICSGLVLVRPGSSASGQRVRLASSGPSGIDLPAVLGIEILDVWVDLVPAIPHDALPAAFAEGTVDALFLHGHKVEDQLRAATAVGARPLFAFGTPDPSGALVRPPPYPAVPTLAELFASRRGQPPAGPLYDGWCAAAIAAQLEFALVLPQLTPAAMVALWRRAATEAASTLDVQAFALDNGLRTMSGGDAAAALTIVATDRNALQAVRSWLADRFNWRPA
jgi:hypothetical protein